MHLKKYDARLFGMGDSLVSISTGAIGAFCKDLQKRGWLESKRLLPPRSNKKSDHYHLPTVDPTNILKVARYLTGKMPKYVLESDYGGFLLEEAVVPCVEGTLDQKLDFSMENRLKEICGSSPSALRQVFDPGIINAVGRIADARGNNEPLIEYLVSYLEALRIVDIAEGRFIRCIK